MVKKTVKLVAQERFDLLDAQALQQGTLEYLGSVLGNLMGSSNGMLSELTLSIDTANKTITFTDRFAFFVTTPTASVTNRDGTGYRGEVVLYDPENPAQAIQSIDYTAAKNAKDAYFADGSLDAEGEDASEDSRLLPVGDFAPFLWARPIQVEGQLDARRKWSVAQQTEVPVTMNTRTITAVEFAFSTSMPLVAEGTSTWAPIAKIIDWSGDSPTILRISAFDGAKWANRAGVPTLGDIDQTRAGIQKDWFSNSSSNLSSFNLFDRYSFGDTVPVSVVYSLLFNYGDYDGPAVGNRAEGINSDLYLFNSWLAADESRTLKDAGVQEYRSGAARPWTKATDESSNGIADQLAAIKTVIQNALGDGIFDHGKPDTNTYPKLAPYGTSDSSYQTLISALEGKFQSHWTAKPLRSLNSLALEALMMADDLSDTRTTAAKNAVDIALLKARVDALEAQEDPFASVPINDAAPLVPALSLTFKTEYGKGCQGFTMHAGPSGAVHDYQFFVQANAYSQVTYARGGFVVVLSNDCIESLGGRAAIENGQIVIQATPLHFSNSSPWLHPAGGNYGVGRVDDQAQHDFPSVNITAESLKKSDAQQVLNAFANFYQCTLNVFVDTRKGAQVSIHVYPVNTVPDIVEQGHDLRGYPHFGGWVGRTSDHANAQGTYGEALIQTDSNGLDVAELDVIGDPTYAYLAGDVTNPDIYRTRNGVTDISDGNYVSSGLSKDDVFGKNDDLRGFAQTVTFLRPDRFSILTQDNGHRIAAPAFGAEHNAPSTHITNEGVRLSNFGDLPEVMGTNGRFMPSFSLVVYKNTFTGLGTDINDESVKKILTPDNGGIRLDYNSADVPNEDGDVITTGDTSTRGGF